MKKIIQILILVCVTATVSFAQQRQSSDQRVADKAKQEKMETLKSCPELLNQLTKLYGEKFDINDAKVIATLNKNINDKKASEVIRKNSLLLVYGEKYLENKHLIDQPDK